MRMALALSVTLAQAACVATPPAAPAAREPLRVTNAGQPFRAWEGAAARRAADAACGPRGVRASIYDRHEGGTWVFPGGCA
jgi:hypothetical protein